MTHGTEVHEETNKTKSMPMIAKKKTQRTKVGKTKKGRARDTDVREHCGIQGVVRWERQRRGQ